MYMIPNALRVTTGCTRALSTKAPKPLYGTVPSHSSYVFLHSNDPPSSFPVKISTAIQRELQLRTMKLGTIVNSAWTGAPPNLSGDKTAATVFSRLGGRLEIPEVSLENMNEVEARLKEHIQRQCFTPETHEEAHLFVCTHGARDCRCGERGGLVARLLREEIERRKLGHRLKVREVGHVGGHKYVGHSRGNLFHSHLRQICRQCARLSAWRMVSLSQNCLWIHGLLVGMKAGSTTGR
jgi:hypothetical protein